MAFPPPKMQKPGMKQWAGGGAPTPPPGQPPAGQNPPPGQDPNQPPAADPQAPIDPNQPQPKPPVPTADPSMQPEGDPQMMSRAHQALARLLMDGGLSKEVDVMLMQAMQRLVEHRKGGPVDGASTPPDGEDDPNAKKNPFAKGADPNGAPDASKQQAPGKAPPFPPKAGPPKGPPAAAPFGKKPPFPPK